MSNAKRAFKGFGLTLVAIMGLMVFMTAGAQAVTWDIAGKEITAHASAEGKLKTEGLLLVPKLNLIIHCKTVTVTEGLLYNTANKAHATLNYSNCLTLINNIDQPLCHPTILPVKIEIEPILHPTGGRTYLLIRPLDLKIFTTLHFLEESCALPPLTSVTGSVVFECEDGNLVATDCKTARVSQLIKPAPAALFPTDTLQYGLNPATIHGEAEVFLIGGNLGKTFNALTP